MDGYTPIPFARPPIDQTAERLKLADLLYQANMARVQAEQERQMTYARMIAQTGQMIGSGIEDYLTRQQRERALAIQAERENRMASAQEAQNAMMMQRMAAEDARNTLALQENLYDKMAGGATMYGGEGEMRQRLGPYADLMQFSPEVTATQQRITPAETLKVGPSAMPAQPGVLESKPMNLAVLAGTAEPTTTTYEASMTKPYSAAEQKSMDEAAQQERQRSVQMEFARIMGDESIPYEEQRRLGQQLMASGLLPTAVYSAAFPNRPAQTPQQQYESGQMTPEQERDYLARIGRRADVTRAPSKPEGPEKNEFREIGGDLWVISPEGEPIRKVVVPQTPMLPLSAATSAAVAKVGMTLSKAQTDAFKQDIAALSERMKDDPVGFEREVSRRAYDYVLSSGTAEERSKRQATEQTLNTLDDFENLLAKIDEIKKYPDSARAKQWAKLYQAIPDTGLVEGGVEQLLNRFGISRNSDLAALGFRLNAFRRNYQRGMSGLAFSIPELSEYKRDLPSIMNSPTLNLSQVRGLKEEISSEYRNFWDRVLGAGGADWANTVRRSYRGARPEAGKPSAPMAPGTSLQDRINQVKKQQ